MATDVHNAPAGAAVPAGPRPRKRPGTARRSRGWGAVRAAKGAGFATPFFLGFLFVFVIPLLYALYKSLFKLESSGLGIGTQTEHFAGFANYTRGLTDGTFWAGAARVLLFACVQIPLMLGLALIMALLLDAVSRRTAHRYRFAFLVPYMIPGIVGTLIWLYIYSPRLGPLTDAFDMVGIDANFFSSGLLWISMGNLLTWTHLGFNMLILYGALQAIPRDLFDAARVDGASELRIALSIKVPYVRGAMVLTGMLSIIGMLQLFNEPLLFRTTAPETVTKSYTPIMAIYFQAFDSNNYNYAAALSVILAVAAGGVSFLFYRLTNRPQP